MPGRLGCDTINLNDPAITIRLIKVLTQSFC